MYINANKKGAHINSCISLPKNASVYSVHCSDGCISYRILHQILIPTKKEPTLTRASPFQKMLQYTLYTVQTTASHTTFTPNINTNQKRAHINLCISLPKKASPVTFQKIIIIINLQDLNSCIFRFAAVDCDNFVGYAPSPYSYHR